MQGSAWSGTNWFLILFLILGSALLAFLGDVLGFRYGKQRISVFGLRPKHTSRLITAITGGLISLLVLTVLSLFSRDVRTALFSMKYIQQQILDLRVQLQESQENALQAQDALSLARESLSDQQMKLQTAAASLDLVRLDLNSLRNDRVLLEQERDELEASVKGMREESQQLKSALHAMKNESIALHANLLLAQRAFEPEMSREDVEKGLQELKQQVRLSVLVKVSKKLLSRLRDLPIEFDPAEETALTESLTGAPVRHYVRALCLENVAFGEKIQVKLVAGVSHRIYRSGEVIYRKMMRAEFPDFDEEEALHIFLRDLKFKAIRDGVLPDPDSNNVGTMEGEVFFEAVESLREIDSPVIVNALASGDIWTEGPVQLQITFEE